MDPLILTKVTLPSARPALVLRPRLVDQLNAGLRGKLTVISAPAGYGKTTLAVAWLAQAGRTVAWLALDEEDNDPARFLTYFIAAMQAVDVSFGREIRKLLLSPEPPPQNLLLTTLFNELAACPSPFVLALDDYQVVQTSSIHHLLNFISERAPESMHLVLITREDPPLPLPRLRARSQVTEIRQDDLRFTEQECSDFLERVMGLPIGKNDVAALERRTEGWIAGLQLAALAMQSLAAQGQEVLPRFVKEFTGSNRYVLDYLAQEVFERQPKDVQDFLIQTSILDRLQASLCDAVTGVEGSQETIETMERANLFIVPLDLSRTWYRYHHLFRDLLHKRLVTHDAPALENLHLRASAWYEAQNLLSDAVHHALAGADWQRTLRLIHDLQGPMTKRGEVFTLLRWFNHVPVEKILEDTESCLGYGWVLMLVGQFEQAGHYLQAAEQHARVHPDFWGQVLSAQAYLARAEGDHPRMVALSQRALALLPEEDLESRCVTSINLGIAYWHSGNMTAAERALDDALKTGRQTGNFYAVSTALLFQGMALAVRGRLHDARDIFLTIVQQDEPPAFLLGLAYLYLSVLYYEWNLLEKGGTSLREAVKTAERIQNDELLVVQGMMKARIHMAGGNLAAAGNTLENAYQKAQTGEVSAPVFPRLAATRVQHAIACGDMEAAARWAAHLAEGSDCHTFYRFANTTEALYLIAQHKTSEAAAHLVQSFEQASQAGWVYAKIAIRVLQARAAADPDAAFDFLVEAMRWAQPEGFLRTFADLGDGLQPMLQAAIRRQVLPEYAREILSVMNAGVPKQVIGQLVLVEPLNPRELDVLLLLASGQSNSEIANVLVISTGTVKTHVHNICGKLGVRNRTEAAARALELGLIEAPGRYTSKAK